VKRSDETSQDMRVFRYWVEIRELATGSVRTLPLTAVMRICLVRGKKNEPPPPDRELLELTDGEATLEANDLDDLRTQLREKYPDAVFERTLHYERDRDAEERREKALNGLVQLLAERAVEQALEEESHGASSSSLHVAAK
jgi:hypothetical protein